MMPDANGTYTMRIGFLNINKQLEANAEEIYDLFDTKNLDLIQLDEIGLKKAQTNAIKGTVAESRAEIPPAVRHQATGAQGKDGVLVATNNDRIPTSVIDICPNGRWVVTRIGPVVLITAYIPPREHDPRELERFNTMRDTMLRRFNNSPVICMGDWNARMGARTGDHQVTSDPVRRRWMADWLDNPEWTRMEPREGKWTTVVKAGKGITDFVFLNRLAGNIASNLIVHDQDCIAGSDHRLLTLEVKIGALKPEFHRLNVRKLVSEKVAFGKELRKGEEKVYKKLVDISTELYRAAAADEKWTWERRRQAADEAMGVVNDWLYNTARDTVGYTHFQGGTIPRRANRANTENTG